MKSPDKERWIKEAAEHARAVADNTERYGYKRAPQGGWTWENLNDDTRND